MGEGEFCLSPSIHDANSASNHPPKKHFSEMKIFPWNDGMKPGDRALQGDF